MYLNVLKKIVITILLLTSCVAAQAAGTWYMEATVERVSSVSAGLFVVASKGCQLAPGANNVYVTNAFEESTHTSRIMSMLLTAQSAGKKVTFFADCTANTIIQICIHGPGQDLSSGC
jgi:hypothetical protein